ncbi:MAG TPA: hydantoinase/oxoprolinase family protein [Vicinamibacteria bacterium]|nr:hydantoinase/oxoprolinase family protein [Vicinamibacteria bacterium]
MGYRLGIDVGGTFTDLLLFHEETGRIWRAKTPSTPADQSVGVLNGINLVCERAGIHKDAIDSIIHGTTVGTNAVLEGKGGRVGLVTTIGFEQILHLARGQTPGPLAGWMIMMKPDPRASLEDTVEAQERMDARGQVVRKLDVADIKAKIEGLVKKGIESLTVSLINSFANPAHEYQIRDIAKQVAPKLPVTCSYDVLPQFREYERTETAVLNSYIRPNVSRYLHNLETKLKGAKLKAILNVLRSDGGLMSVHAAEDKPVNLLMSGPSGGVTGALFIANRAGFPNMMTFDMGGTSTDVSLNMGEASIGRETNIATFASQNTVLPIKVASVDVRTIGAGGGSIAHVPALTKALRIGPMSAGADPGPACYGKGGVAPTVTDANVVLGHLPPQLLGGKMKLDVEKAKAAVKTIGDAIGLEVHAAAEGIINIVNESMCGALRLVSVERGHDPREFALVAFGGAGPLHGNALGAIMGSWPVIVPPAPGVLCALGDVSSEYRNEFTRTFTSTVDKTKPEDVVKAIKELGQKASDWLTSEGITGKAQHIRYEADVRYYRQGYELPIVVNPDKLLKGFGPLLNEFHATHQRLYQFRMDVEVEIVNLRAIGIGKTKQIKLAKKKKGKHDPKDAVTGSHDVYFKGSWVKTKVYDRAKLQPGHVVKGPAIVLEEDSTTLIHPKHKGMVDEYSNILIYPAGK